MRVKCAACGASLLVLVLLPSRLSRVGAAPETPPATRRATAAVAGAGVAQPGRSRRLHRRHRRGAARHRRDGRGDAERHGDLRQGLRSGEHRDQHRRSRPRRSSRIGSVTKQFTCAVALQLEQEGKLSFDDPVAKYDPALTRASDITVRDIGGMVSGYRDYYPLDFVDRPMAAAAAERRDRQGLRRAAARLRAALPLLLQQHRLPAARPHRRDRRRRAVRRRAAAAAVHAARADAHPLRAGARRPRHGRGLHAARSRRRRAGDSGRRGLDRRRRRDLVDAVGPAALGPGADGRQGAVAGRRSPR